jgi:hypothetical protein
MKITVAKTELETKAKTLAFGALQAFVDFGTDDGHGGRVFDKAKLDLILTRYQERAPLNVYSLPTPSTAGNWNPAKADEIIAARRKVCFGEGAMPKCDFNVDNLCQHPGCKTCPGKQRNAGALEGYLALPYSTCPANKWNSIKL